MPVLDVTYDDREFRELLEGWDEKEVRKTLRRAATAWGRKASPVVAAATPVAAPGNRYVSRGALQRSVKARAIRKGRSRGVIGVVVGPMGKDAFYRHMVTGGTKPHLILPKERGFLRIGNTFARSVQHPGARANPFVERAAPAAEQAGDEAAMAAIDKALDAKAT